MSSPNQLSFLPDDYLEGKRQRRTNVVLAVLFVIILSCIVTAAWISKQSLRQAELEHDEADRQYAEAAKKIEQVRQMQEKQRKMASQAELTASLLEKVPRSFLLAEVTNAMPPGISLLDVILDSKIRTAPVATAGKTQFEMKKAAQGSGKAGMPAPTAKQYDVTVRVTGIADNDVQVAQFMNRLNTSKLLRDVNLVITDEFNFNENKMRKFQVEMTVDPSAEVSPATLNVKTAAMPLGEK